MKLKQISALILCLIFLTASFDKIQLLAADNEVTKVKEKITEETSLSDSAIELLFDDEVLTTEEYVSPEELINVSLSDSGTCGDEAVWSLDDSGLLTISGSGDLADYTSYNSIPWYSCRSDIYSVNIESGITNICDYAFYNCSNLTNINIPDSVISIGGHAFYRCNNLTSVNIPNGVTRITLYTFYGCSNLTTIIFPDNLTYIGQNAFQGCSSLTDLEIPDSVTSLGYYAFHSCSSLINVKLPSSIKTIGEYLFCNCSCLTSVEIPNNVTTIHSHAFFNCNSLTTVNIPDSVISIGSQAFYNCQKLTDIELSDNTIKIDDKAFSGCENLKNINIPSKVTNIGESVFYNCINLKSINVDSGNVTYKSIDGVLYNYDITELICCPGGKEEATIENTVTNIDAYAFGYCVNLTNVEISNSVTNIGERAFVYCTSLTNIEIPSSITVINDGLFGNCSNLVSVEIPNSIISINESAFASCCCLANIEIPSSVTSIGSYAFKDCSALENLTIPNGVVSVGAYAFSGCKKITSIELLNVMTTIEENTFSYCNDLTSIVIPDGAVSIGDNAFYSCTSLITVELPDSITSIGKNAFYFCESLTNITIPNNIASINDFTFNYCSSLTSIAIPDNVTSISKYAFSGCDKDQLVFYVYEGSYADTWAQENGWMVSYETIPTVYIYGIGSDSIALNRTLVDYDLRLYVNRETENADEISVTSSDTSIAEISEVKIGSELEEDGITYFWVILDMHNSGTTTITATDTVTGAAASYTLTITGNAFEIVSVTYDDNIWSGGLIGALVINVEFNKEIEILDGDIEVYCDGENILSVPKYIDDSIDDTNWYTTDKNAPNKIIIYITKSDVQYTSTEIDGVNYVYNYLLTYKPMTFYIDETVLTPADSSVEFETLSFTVDLEDYNLDYPTDIFSWRNTSDYFNTSNYHLNSAFDSRLNLGLFVLYCWRNNTPWKGSCYGMCALISLIKNGQFDIRNINLNEFVTNTCDLPMPRISENIGGVRDWVNYMYFLQKDKRIKEIKKYAFMPKMFSTEYESEDWSGTEGDSQEILQEIIDNAKGNNTNYIFEFAWVDPTSQIIQKHAILPFSYYYAGTESMHKIVCYDPSIVTFSTVSINNDLSDFSVNNWTDSPIEVGYTDLTDFDNIFDLSVVKPTTYLSTYSSDLSAASEEDSTDGTKISLWANSDFEIKVGDKSLLYNDGTFSGDYDIINNLDIMANGDGSSLLMFTVDDAETYVVSSNSDSLDCTLETSDMYAFSQMSGSGLTATFDCENSQIINEGNISEYAVALNYDDSNMIVVNGDNETEVVLSSGDEMAVSTESGGEVTLDIVNDGEQTGSETISNSDDITIVKNETGLEVSSEEPYTETSTETTTEGEFVSPPAFEVAGVFGGRNVTFTSETDGAVIYYSSTSSTLTTDDISVSNGETVLFEDFYGTIYARAYHNGSWSNVARLILKIPVVNTPTVTASGSTVTIKSTTPSSFICYTTDGSEPVIKTDGTVTNGTWLRVNGARTNSGTITATPGDTVRAVAVRNCFTTSASAAVYVNVSPAAFKVVGTFGGRNVTFTSDTSGAKIYYSSTTSSLTTNDKCVSNGETVLFEDFYGTIYARAYYNGKWSNVSRLILKIPTINDPTITYSGGKATIRTTTPNCYIYYTTDGTTPSVTNGKKLCSNSYGQVTVSSGTTIKAIAVRSCFTNSTVTTYKIS